MRRGAAIALVGALAVGWLTTSRIGRTKAEAATKAATVTTPSTGRDRADEVLRRVVPAGAQCGDQHGSDAVTRCSVSGIDVDYRLLRPDAAQSAYLAAIGGSTNARASDPGSPACALGGEEERPWSRPDTPGRTAGRYACRVEQGRAAMWWTVEDRGVLAHATASDADLTSLFAWWASHSER